MSLLHVSYESSIYNLWQILGGYAFVFIAQDVQSNQDYALKVI